MIHILPDTFQGEQEKGVEHKGLSVERHPPACVCIHSSYTRLTLTLTWWPRYTNLN